MAVIAYLLFFLAGLGFGYAAEGIDGTLLLRLGVALVVTAAGVLLGMVLDPGEQPGRAEPGWR